MSPWRDNILVQHPTQWRSFPKECRFLLHRLLKNGIKEINKLVCRGGVEMGIITMKEEI